MWGAPHFWKGLKMPQWRLCCYILTTTLSIKLGVAPSGKPCFHWSQYWATTSTLVSLSGTAAKPENKECEIKQQKKKQTENKMTLYWKIMTDFLGSFMQQKLEQIIIMFSKNKKSSESLFFRERSTNKGRAQIKIKGPINCHFCLVCFLFSNFTNTHKTFLWNTDKHSSEIWNICAALITCN